jgi:nitrogen fixation protein NifQ
MDARTNTLQLFAPRDLMLRLRPGKGRLGIALAGVIGRALESCRRPLIRGLSEARFQKLLNEFFPDCELTNGEPAPGLKPPGEDEFDDLVALLLEHRAEPTEERAWLSFAMASAAMGEDHLWQDMGLPSRTDLSALIADHYPALSAANSGNMKWKKFFYRQLCERAGVPICKSPHCADCCDYRICFGPES